MTDSIVYTRGTYKTMLGLRAVVGKIQSVNGRWILKGAISMDGVWWLHLWNVNGKSLSTQTMFDLTRSP